MAQGKDERISFWVLIGVEVLLIASIIPAVLWVATKLPEF